MDSYKIPVEGIMRLKEESSHPYFLIIEGYVRTGEGQQSILAKAREVSPDTQRLLVAAPSELPSFVNAINFAGIHACMPLPFTDDALLGQVRLRYDEFEAGRKKKNLQNTIQRQNKQLFQIAGNLRKKETVFANRVQQKEKQIRVLKSRLRASFGDMPFETGEDLKRFLQKENISFNSFAFRQAFEDVQVRVSDIFSTILSEKGIFDAITPVYKHDETVDTSVFKPFAGQLTQALLHYMTWQSRRKFEQLANQSPAGADKRFTIEFSDDMLQAYIRLNPGESGPVTLYMVKQCLEQKEIKFGIKDNTQIEDWLYEHAKNGEKLLIAQGRPPTAPTNGEIQYYFSTNFRQAGRVNSDGSIDFRDRGEVPHVEDGMLLATRVLSKPGITGVDVKGRQIPVEDPVDPAFISGQGTRINEEQTQIHSADQGEPHLDVMGVISVNKELLIKGDVGFETGNIDFKGNVIVPGTVKEGFKVKCVSLTAKEISGAQIDASGDLNVSMGILDTQLINVKGDIKAKYIRNSKINAFGDLTIQKEIIDSTIYLSGACNNGNGVILNSYISAKLGIKAGTVGNESAKPSVLTVGVDEHLNRIRDKAKSKLEMNKSMIKELASEISQMKEVDKWIHATITGSAHIQDRAQLDIRVLEKKRAALDKTKDAAAFERISLEIRKLEKKAKDAEKKINDGFAHQDQIYNDISVKGPEIKALELSNKQLVEMLVYLEQISNKSDPVPELHVSRRIEPLTKVRAVQSDKILDKQYARCIIREKSRGEMGITYYVMEIV